MGSSLLRRLLAVSVIIVVPAVVFAQEAALTGVVTDATTAVLPGVTIKAVHAASGNTFEAVTDQRGAYRIPVRVGVYKITATLSGVNTVTRDGVEILVGQTTTGSKLRLQNAAPLMAAAGDPSQLRASAPVLAGLSLDNLGVTQGAVPPIPLAPGLGSGPAPGSSPGFRSALTGEFELTGIPAGDYRVFAGYSEKVQGIVDHYSSPETCIQVSLDEPSSVILTLHKSDDSEMILSDTARQKMGIDDELAKYLN